MGKNIFIMLKGHRHENNSSQNCNIKPDRKLFVYTVCTQVTILKCFVLLVSLGVDNVLTSTVITIDTMS